MAKFTWYWPEKTHVRWQKMRAKGRTRYVLFTGVLSWGLAMFLVMALLPYLFDVPIKVHGDRLNHLISGLVLWPLAGVFFGFATWHANEKYYQRQEKP